MLVILIPFVAVMIGAIASEHLATKGQALNGNKDQIEFHHVDVYVKEYEKKWIDETNINKKGIKHDIRR